MASDDDVEVIRNFTPSRNFPQMIGRTPDGRRIWGGPYTITQALGAGVVITGLYLTRDLWTHFGLFTSALIALIAVAAVVVGLGRLRPGARNPLSLLGGTARAMTAPRSAKLDGRPVRRPHQTYVGRGGYIQPTPRR